MTFEHPIIRMAAFVIGLLLTATVAVWLLRRLNPAKDYSELSARVTSWWWMALLLIFALGWTRWIALALFCFVSFWAMKEFVTLLKTRPADHRTLALAFLSIPVQYYWIARDWYGMFIIFIPVYMFLILAARLVLARETAGFVASASQIHWGLMAFVFGLSHLAALNRMPEVRPGVDGRALVLFLIFVTEISDVLQYVWGKTLGRHPILPAVSPNKTWEGFLGGAATACLLSLAIRFLTPFSVIETLGISLMITVAGFLGGAVMSAVKRDFGVKDFGGVIAGHGGVLDRVDSLCYAAPLFFHYIRYFWYR